MAGLVLVLIWISSEFKYAVMAMNLHVYDAALYLTALTKYAFFVATFPRQSALVGALLLSALLTLTLMWWAEAPWRVALARRLAILGASLVLCGLAALPFKERNVQFFIPRSGVFSAFFASMGDLPDLIRFEGGLRMAHAARPARRRWPATSPAIPVRAHPTSCCSCTNPRCHRASTRRSGIRRSLSRSSPRVMA